MLLPQSLRTTFLVAQPSDALPAACLAIREALGAYVDGELPAAERARVLAHLTACDRCAAAERGLRGCVDAVRRTARLERAPRSLHVRALQLLDRIDGGRGSGNGANGSGAHDDDANGGGAHGGSAPTT